MPKRISSQHQTSYMNENDDYNNLSFSFTIAPNELRNIMNGDQGNDSTLRELMEDGSTTGTVLKAKEPWREVSLKLYYDFLDSLQNHTSNFQTFETVSEFIQNCTHTLEMMRGMNSKIEKTEMSPEEINLENERNTWRLVYCLYQNRIESAEAPTHIENTVSISEKEVIEALYKSSKLIREYQLIIDWLEKNALDQADKLPSIENYTDRTIAWENSLHQLQNKKTGITFGSTRPIVTSLDPDAPIREGKPLHDLDKEDDARLEKRMLTEVRCGRLQKAQALAKHCGQQWRAACLLGWVPYHDPNYTNPLSDMKLPVEGNPNRSLWKFCAWELSEDIKVGQYYRAIYSSLCGNLQQLLTIAQSWQDGLWGYMKTLLDIKVEAEVRGFMPKSYIPMPDDYWKGELTLEEIFEELEGSKNSVIRSQANQPAHQIQKYIILDDITMLMNSIDELLNQEVFDSQFLRFLAHLVLFFKQIGKKMNKKIADKVLLAYVKVLIEMNDPSLVAFYTATLPKEAQIVNYAQFLENVKDYEQRKRCLEAAEEENLNILAITKLVVENIRQKNFEIQSVDLKGNITDADSDKINAIDWLTFYPAQRDEALWQTNALIRYFLTNEKLDAARKAFNKIPDDSIDTIFNEFPGPQNTIDNLMSINNIPRKVSSSIREYLCYKSYLDAQEGFSEWFSHYHHDKPVPLEDLPEFATFTEKVAHDHKKTQYNSQLERWRSTMQQHTKAVKQLLFNVLLFPDGGWLVDSNNIDVNDPMTSEEILREHQLQNLRKICIPKITLLLYTVMSEMNEHAECIKLADTLASEQYQLFKIIPKEKLGEIYKKICESSLKLMDQKKDPWGYSK